MFIKVFVSPSDDRYFKGVSMRRKLTITIDEDVYDGLYRVAGRRNVSKFIESMVRPHIPAGNLDEGYRQMAGDAEREAEAAEWIERTAT